MTPSAIVVDRLLLWMDGHGVIEWLNRQTISYSPTVFAVCDDDSYTIPHQAFFETDFLLLRPQSSGDLLPLINELEILGTLEVQKFQSSIAQSRRSESRLSDACIR
jgi:hypothetical protein